MRHTQSSYQRPLKKSTTTPLSKLCELAAIAPTPARKDGRKASTNGCVSFIILLYGNSRLKSRRSFHTE